MSKIGDKLHMERRRRKMNLREVSNEVGISPIYISEIETGKKIPTNGEALVTLANFYGLDPIELTKMAFADKADARVQEMENTGEYAAARKKRRETLITEYLEGKDATHQ